MTMIITRGQLRRIIREELSHLGVKDKLFEMSLEDALER